MYQEKLVNLHAELLKYKEAEEKNLPVDDQFTQ